MDRSDLLGGWSMAGMELDIVELDGRLAIAFPEAPHGFESDLVPLDENDYEIRGGQFDGARISFSLDETARVIGMVGPRAFMDSMGKKLARHLT